MKWYALAVLFLIVGGVAKAKDRSEWKTTPFAAQCREVPSGNADEGQDFIFRKCEGPATQWLLYQEGTRLSVGFGKKPHVSAQGLSPERDAKWQVQWGGRMAGGKFAPLIAIVRFRKLEEAKSTLFVFRLLENGSSCLVGEVAASADQSTKAKVIAEAAMTDWECQTAAVPVTS
jgi:hypothetical protein